MKISTLLLVGGAFLLLKGKGLSAALTKEQNAVETAYQYGGSTNKLSEDFKGAATQLLDAVSGKISEGQVGSALGTMAQMPGGELTGLLPSSTPIVSQPVPLNPSGTVDWARFNALLSQQVAISRAIA